MEITASMVKDLREQTGVGMMECKKALAETNGDMDAARKLLRERGMASATKRDDRTAAQGIITSAVSCCNNTGALVELNCETDFVARNEDFLALADEMVNVVLANKMTGANEELLAVASGDETIGAKLENLVIKIREKMGLGRYLCYTGTENAIVDAYIHQGGQIGVLTELQVGDAEALKKPELAQLARELSMHISFVSPKYLDRDEVDAAEIAAEQEIQKQRALNEGKPEAALPKIIEGRMGKFFEQVTLLDSKYIRDEKQSIRQVIEAAAKTLGTSIKISRYARYRVGEVSK